MNDREQEPNRLDSKKQPKINGKGKKKKAVEDDDSDEGEGNYGDTERSNDEDNYDDSRSQKRFSCLKANNLLHLLMVVYNPGR